MSLKKIFALWAAIVAVTMLFSGCSFSTKVLGELSEPDSLVYDFFDCLCSGRYDDINDCLCDQKLNLVRAAGTDDFDNMFLKHLQESYKYEVVGKSNIDGLNAVCKVNFTYLDPQLMKEDLRSHTKQIATQYITLLDPVYTNNDDGIYSLNKEGAEHTVLLALEEILETPEKYYSTKQFDIRLSYAKKAWKITLDDDLFNAISGYYLSE